MPASTGKTGRYVYIKINGTEVAWICVIARARGSQLAPVLALCEALVALLGAHDHFARLAGCARGRRGGGVCVGVGFRPQALLRGAEAIVPGGDRRVQGRCQQDSPGQNVYAVVLIG